MLDSLLDQPVSLTLYGRAAFFLGFGDQGFGFSQSLDVDVILLEGQAEELGESTNFWEALEEANEALAGEGLYMSHLFVENQVVLSSDWKGKRVALEGDYERLTLFRLGDEDLFLSKLMRDDPQDRSDAVFLVRENRWDSNDLERILASARVPIIAELEEQFRIASAKIREIEP